MKIFRSDTLATSESQLSLRRPRAPAPRTSSQPKDPLMGWTTRGTADSLAVQIYTTAPPFLIRRTQSKRPPWRPPPNGLPRSPRYWSVGSHGLSYWLTNASLPFSFCPAVCGDSFLMSFFMLSLSFSRDISLCLLFAYIATWLDCLNVSKTTRI